MVQNITEMSHEEAEAAYAEACRNLNPTQIRNIEAGNKQMYEQFPKMMHARLLYERVQHIETKREIVGQGLHSLS